MRSAGSALEVLLDRVFGEGRKSQVARECSLAALGDLDVVLK